MKKQSANPLLSSQKSSDSGLQVTLHPLPLLEISDYITRGYQRGLTGAVVGALLGQQNGLEITVEHSFSVKTQKSAKGEYELDPVWFNSRLEQMKTVHANNPPLDLVGWYTLVSKTGPTPAYLPLHNQFLVHNESAILLGFHIDEILRPAPGDPLPLTIYESNLEAEDGGKDAAEDGEDKEMKDLPEAAAKMTLRFRELPYLTETGEAEMIAMQFIREGGANARAGSDSHKGASAKQTAPTQAEAKGKAPAGPSEDDKKDKAAANGGEDANLSKEELEYISTIQAKASAIKMMKSRLDLIVAYLSKLPPAFVSGELSSADAAAHPQPSCTVPSNNILRQIQALVTNIHLITPAEQDDLKREIQLETNDVQLMGLISDLMTTMNSVRDLGKKFNIIDTAKNNNFRNRDLNHLNEVDPIQLGSQAGDLFT